MKLGNLSWTDGDTLLRLTKSPLEMAGFLLYSESQATQTNQREPMPMVPNQSSCSMVCTVMQPPPFRSLSGRPGLSTCLMPAMTCGSETTEEQLTLTEELVLMVRGQTLKNIGNGHLKNLASTMSELK